MESEVKIDPVDYTESFLDLKQIFSFLTASKPKRGALPIDAGKPAIDHPAAASTEFK